LEIKRREFVKIGGVGLVLASLDLRNAFGQAAVSQSSPFSEQLLNRDFPFPYDPAAFEAAERISNVRRSPLDPSVWLTDLNILPKSGKTLDIQVAVADRREALGTTPDVQIFTGVKDSLDLQVRGMDSPRLYYQVRYREGKGAWKALAPRNFKLPNAKLRSGGQINAFFMADDHNFDDGDWSVTPEYAQSKITGDYFYDFMANMRRNTNWGASPPVDRFTFSYSMILGLRHILAYEDPDFFVNLGDSTGIGASYRWQNWGLPYKNLSEKDYDYIARVLWLRTRKAFSAVTPNMPVYWALGNHDGDESWTGSRLKAKYYRQKLFPLPTQTTYPEGGHPDGNYYAFTWGADEKNRGGAQFIFLDVCGFNANEPKKITEWTLGGEQLKWFENVLSRSDSEWSFACGHHVLGGWPAGPTELETHLAYGRGPLFTKEEYAPYADPAKVEQVKLTDLGKTYGLRAFIYGHDHIFYAKKIGEGANKKDLYGICAGSPKYMGERSWWTMPLWLKHYGDAFKTVPAYFGPSGISRLSIKSDQAKFDYILTQRTPYSNLPAVSPGEGSVLSSIVLTNPPPAVQVDKATLTFETDESKQESPLSAPLKVRNGGGRLLSWSVSSDESWIAVTPENGLSWSAWCDISATLVPAKLEPGSYKGTIRFSSPGLAPLAVPVALSIKRVPLYAPLNFNGTRLGAALSTSRLDTILLTWRPNPLNTYAEKYRLYLLDDAGGKTKIAETDLSTFTFQVRQTRQDTSYRFAIAVVNPRGREGEAAVIRVPASF